MATNDQKAPKTDGSGSLKAHKEPEKLAAHPEPARLEAYNEEEEVPPVTADVEATPKFIQYGAAVLLGCAFGLGCYVWYDGGFPSHPQNPDGPFAPRENSYDYFNSANDYAIYYSDREIPSPFETTAYTQVPEILTPDVVAVPDADAALVAVDNSSAAADDAAAAPVVVYLFEYDSSDIPETAALTDIARRASKAGAGLDVKAYTDERGNVSYNKRLSARRAKAVADYLVAHGMPVAKVKVHAMGPTHAFGSDAADRRAEIRQTGK